MPIKPAKFVLDILDPHLTHIFNLALEFGEFPIKMQTAKVRLLHKRGKLGNKEFQTNLYILVFLKLIEN